MVYHYYAELRSCGQAVAQMDGIAQVDAPVESYQDYTKLKEEIMDTVENPPIDAKLSIHSLTALSS